MNTDAPTQMNKCGRKQTRAIENREGSAAGSGFGQGDNCWSKSPTGLYWDNYCSFFSIHVKLPLGSPRSMNVPQYEVGTKVTVGLVEPPILFDYVCCY